MNNIEKLIQEAKTNKSSDSERTLIQKMSIISLKAPCENGDNKTFDGKWRQSEGQQETVKVNYVGKKEYLVLFTSDVYFKKYTPDGGYFTACFGSTWFQICIDDHLDGVILNPRSELQLILPTERLKDAIGH